jgi:tRNA synthetases class I (I, L, M and V)
MVLSLLLWSSTSTGCHTVTAISRNQVLYPAIRTSTAFVVPNTNSKSKSALLLQNSKRFTSQSNVVTSQLRSSVTICNPIGNSYRRWGMLNSVSTSKNRLERHMSTINDELMVSLENSNVKSYDLLNRERGILDKYDPSTFEKDIYQWWEQSGCFQPDAQDTMKLKNNDKKPYVLPMPPPNVTGRLHMGHAIFVALQDVLARFHRMRGRPVLWLPGTDHAGIATQLQVEKILISEGTTREAVGREVFLQRVWDYKNEQGGFITQQLRSLGASADWSRERFTMDSELSDAVVEAFVRLHEKGLIYRGEYMVNWAPMLKTAVSDLEVEYSDELGKLYYFKYMIEGSEGKFEQHEVKYAISLSNCTSIHSVQSFCLLRQHVQKQFVVIQPFVCIPAMKDTNI